MTPVTREGTRCNFERSFFFLVLLFQPQGSKVVMRDIFYCLIFLVSFTSSFHLKPPSSLPFLHSGLLFLDGPLCRFHFSCPHLFYSSCSLSSHFHSLNAHTGCLRTVSRHNVTFPGFLFSHSCMPVYLPFRRLSSFDYVYELLIYFGSFNNSICLATDSQES